MKLRKLKKALAGIEDKYGKKALDFRVEVHNRLDVDGKTRLWVPYDMDFIGVAKYPKDEEFKAERVVVIR